LDFPSNSSLFDKHKHKVGHRVDSGLLQGEFVQPNGGAQAVNYRKPFAHFISEGPSFIAVRSPRFGAIGQ
jgi:hypothetical protein